MTRAKSNELKKALLAYLAAVEVAPDALPPLDNPVDALVEALELGAAHAHGFALLDLSDTPYGGLAAGDPSAPWRMQWAIQVAELEAFTCAALEDTLFVIDTLPDPNGRHRVYTAEDGLRGDLEFNDISDALHWMAARVKASKSGKKGPLTTATKKYATLLDDAWEDDPRSGWNVFESFLDSGFAEAWDALSRGEWPVLDGPATEPPSEPHPTLGRATLAWATEQFVRDRRVTLPETFEVDALSGVHQALLEQLHELEAAVHKGRLPQVIQAATGSADELLRELAGAWKARFDAVQRSLRAPVGSDLDVSPVRRRGKAQRATVVEVPPPDPTSAAHLRADDPGDLDLSALSDFPDLDDLDALGDLDSDDEFAALERELGASNAALQPAIDPAQQPLRRAATGRASKPKGAEGAGKPVKPAPTDELGAMGDLGGLGGALRALLGGGGPDEEDEPEDVEMTPFNQKLMAALDVLLDQMEADEVIEIIPERKQMLVREMVRAASDARSPKHMLSSLTRALVESEQVEEIYATDDQIQRLLRGALGG